MDNNTEATSEFAALSKELEQYKVARKMMEGTIQKLTDIVENRNARLVATLGLLEDIRGTHGTYLASDPPQSMWAVRGIDRRIEEILRGVHGDRSELSLPAGVDHVSMNYVTIIGTNKDGDNPVTYTKNGMRLNLDGFTLYAPGADPGSKEFLVELPPESGCPSYGYDDQWSGGRDEMRDECIKAIIAAGGNVKT